MVIYLFNLFGTENANLKLMPLAIRDISDCEKDSQSDISQIKGTVN